METANGAVVLPPILEGSETGLLKDFSTETVSEYLSYALGVTDARPTKDIPGCAVLDAWFAKSVGSGPAVVTGVRLGDLWRDRDYWEGEAFAGNEKNEKKAMTLTRARALLTYARDVFTVEEWCSRLAPLGDEYLAAMKTVLSLDEFSDRQSTASAAPHDTVYLFVSPKARDETCLLPPWQTSTWVFRKRDVEDEEWDLLCIEKEKSERSEESEESERPVARGQVGWQRRLVQYAIYRKGHAVVKTVDLDSGVRTHFYSGSLCPRCRSDAHWEDDEEEDEDDRDGGDGHWYWSQSSVFSAGPRLFVLNGDTLFEFKVSEEGVGVTMVFSPLSPICERWFGESGSNRIVSNGSAVYTVSFWYSMARGQSMKVLESDMSTPNIGFYSHSVAYSVRIPNEMYAFVTGPYGICRVATGEDRQSALQYGPPEVIYLEDVEYLADDETADESPETPPPSRRRSLDVVTCADEDFYYTRTALSDRLTVTTCDRNTQKGLTTPGPGSNDGYRLYHFADRVLTKKAFPFLCLDKEGLASDLPRLNVVPHIVSGDCRTFAVDPWRVWAARASRGHRAREWKWNGVDMEL